MISICDDIAFVGLSRKRCDVYFGNASFEFRPRHRLLLPVYAVVIFMGVLTLAVIYEGWNFNSGNYLFTTDTK